MNWQGKEQPLHFMEDPVVKLKSETYADMLSLSQNNEKKHITDDIRTWELQR